MNLRCVPLLSLLLLFACGTDGPPAEVEAVVVNEAAISTGDLPVLDLRAEGLWHFSDLAGLDLSLVDLIDAEGNAMTLEEWLGEMERILRIGLIEPGEAILLVQFDAGLEGARARARRRCNSENVECRICPAGEWLCTCVTNSRGPVERVYSERCDATERHTERCAGHGRSGADAPGYPTAEERPQHAKGGEDRPRGGRGEPRNSGQSGNSEQRRQPSANSPNNTTPPPEY